MRREQIKNWLKENWFRLSILFIIILVIIIFCYYYLLFLPNKEKQKFERELQAKEILNTCLTQADWQYLSLFERMARVLKPENWENIPVQINYKNITGDTDSEKKENLKLWENAENNCFKLYNKQ